MSVDIKIKGLDEALAQMENLNPKIDKELTSTLNNEGIEWRDDVRANTPVDSGELRRSMTFEGVKKTGSGFEMSLTNNLSYAAHIEYGHRVKGGGGGGGRKKGSKNKPNDGKNKKKKKSTVVNGVVKGVYMMKKGTTRLEQRLPSKLEEAMERALGD